MDHIYVKRTRQILLFGIGALFALVSGVSAQDQALPMTKVYGVGGAQPANEASPSRLSYDGRYIAFSSYAPNLVLNDTNNQADFFVYDVELNLVERVSVSSDETQGARQPGLNSGLDMSRDGRYVLFGWGSDDLVPGDTNNAEDLFVRDRVNGTTERVNLTASGTQSSGGAPEAPKISDNGRFVVWSSPVTDYVAGDLNGWRDVFVRDLQMGTTSLVSVSSNGVQGNHTSTLPRVSNNGEVFFMSWASNLVPNITTKKPRLYVRNLATNTTELVSVNTDGSEIPDMYISSISISDDGRYVVITGNFDGSGDIYIRDRTEGTTTKILSGGQYVSISSDRRFLAFTTTASYSPLDTLTGQDVYLYDRVTNTYALLSRNATSAGDDISRVAIISGDGSTVAFSSTATNLLSTPDNPLEDMYVLGLPLSPDPLTPANAANITANPPTLTWSSGAGAVTYQVQLGHDNPPLDDPFSVAALSFKPSALLNMPYYWQVRSLGTSGDYSAWSPLRSFNVISAANIAPGVRIINTATPELTWGAVGWATGYQIQVDNNTTFASPEYNNDTLTAGDLSVIVSSLTEGPYFWRVRAKKPDSSWGAWSTADSFVINLP